MTVAKKPANAGKKVAKKQAAVRAAKIQGAAKRKVAAQAGAAQAEITSAAEWAASSATQGMPLTVPSGKTALVRTVGIEAFLQKGLIPNSLRDIAIEAMQGKKPQMKTEGMSVEQIENMVELFDAVTLYCVIKPDVFPVPRWTAEDNEEGLCSEPEVGEVVPPARREAGVLYVDYVDLEDKMFIFQFACGGTRNVEQFRAEFASSVERVSGESNVAADA